MSDILIFKDVRRVFIMNIRKMRKLRDMTQKQLADAIGVDNSIISKYENNIVIPPADRLEAIAQVLNVSLDALINDDNEVYTHSTNNQASFPPLAIGGLNNSVY